MRLYRLFTGEEDEAQGERKKALYERFVRESLVRYLDECGRAAQKQALSGASLAMRKGAHGKPYFCEPGLEDVYFSLSHTEGYAIVCFSDGEIGCDCENTKARGSMERLSRVAARCFTDDEIWYVAASRDGAPERFFEVWTSKEAYMKYTGNGFSEGFKSFSVLEAKGVVFETGRFDEAPHVVYSVCIGASGNG